MKLSQIYNTVIKHFSNKKTRINILYYFIAAGVVGYFYSLKVVFVFILMLLSILIFSSFLLTLYNNIRLNFRILDKEFFYSFLLTLIVLPIAFIVLEKQFFGYTIVLGVIIAGISIIRIN